MFPLTYYISLSSIYKEYQGSIHKFCSKIMINITTWLTGTVKRLMRLVRDLRQHTYTTPVSSIDLRKESTGWASGPVNNE